MAKGRFIIRYKNDPQGRFIAFDADEANAPCTEATNHLNLGLGLAARSACRFKQIEPGETKSFCDYWEYFVEWREAPIVQAIREHPRAELVVIN